MGERLPRLMAQYYKMAKLNAELEHADVSEQTPDSLIFKVD